VGVVVSRATAIAPAVLDVTLTRATLLKAGIGTALAASWWTLPRTARPLAWLEERAAAHLRRSTYVPHLNTTFRIRRASGPPLPAKLTKIRDLPPGTVGESSERSFSLVFRGPRRASFTQDSSLVVEHRALGRFQLAVVPVGQAKGSQDYEAIVDRREPARQRRFNG
jgi:hypothetical protein